MKFLKRIYIFTTVDFNDNLILNNYLNENKYIEELEFHAINPQTKTLQLLIPFLLSAPNLINLGVWKLKNDLLEFVALKLKNLKSITCASIESDCESHYNELKEAAKNKFFNDKISMRSFLNGM
jgi:hypothetical protein